MKMYYLRPHCLSGWPLSVYRYTPYPTNEPEHGHDCYEIMIAMRDGGVCTVGDNNYAIRAGSVFLCTPKDRHAYSIPVESMIYNIMFSPEILSYAGQKLLAAAPGGAYQMFDDENDIRQLNGILATLESELIEQRRGFECLTGALMEFLITSICRKTNELPNFTELRSSNEVEKLLAYIQKHYSEKITLATMGRLIRRSPAYCGQLFKRVAGCPFSKFLLRYRISKAQELLKSSPLSLTEIAYQTGFFDSAHFSKVFHRMTGHSPLFFRRKFQADSEQDRELPGD